MTWLEIYDKTLAEFPKDKFKDMKEAVKHFDGFGFEKYFDYEFSLTYASQCAAICGAERGGLEVFDMGTGFAYFPYVCKVLGNNIDVCDTMQIKCWLCEQGRKALGFHVCRDYTLIRAIAPPDDHSGEFHHKPLPFCRDQEGKKKLYDIVSAFAVAPHSMFGEDDWHDLMKDCTANMKQGGILYLNPNESKGLEALKRIELKGETSRYAINIISNKR